jgi:hypothetical protein
MLDMSTTELLLKVSIIKILRDKKAKFGPSHMALGGAVNEKKKPVKKRKWS